MNNLERTLTNGSCFVNALRMIHPVKEIRQASAKAIAEVSLAAIELK